MVEREDDPVREAIATNMSRARAALRLSLRDLAELTGLSPALLSQVERAVANPTLDALSKIGSALHLSFAELTRRGRFEPVVRRAGEGPSTVDKLTGSVIRDLFDSPEKHRFEVRLGTFPPDCLTPDSSHGVGSIEYMFVVSGRVHVTVDDWSEWLERGDALSFSGESAHDYSTGDDPCEIVTIVALPDGWDPGGVTNHSA